jgi:hypothetical protein
LESPSTKKRKPSDDVKPPPSVSEGKGARLDIFDDEAPAAMSDDAFANTARLQFQPLEQKKKPKTKKEMNGDAYKKAKEAMAQDKAKVEAVKVKKREESKQHASRSDAKVMSIPGNQSLTPISFSEACVVSDSRYESIFEAALKKKKIRVVATSLDNKEKKLLVNLCSKRRGDGGKFYRGLGYSPTVTD